MTGQHAHLRLERGAWVRTLVELSADADGFEEREELRLPAGTRAQVHETPSENGGFFSIAVGTNLYDVSHDEIAPAAAPLAPAPAVGTCVTCGASAALRCSRCRAATYCSRSCQARHWKGHRAACGADAASALPRGARTPPLSLLSVCAREDAADADGEDGEHERAWLAAAQRWLYALRDSDRAGLAAAVGAFGEALDAAPPTVMARRAHLRARRHLFYGLALFDACEAGERAGAEPRAAALASLKMAVELAPRDAEAVLELGLALEHAGAFDKARAHAARAVARGVLWRDAWQRPGTMAAGLAAAELRAVWRCEQFPWVTTLEAHAALIRAELAGLGAAHGGDAPRGAWHAVGGTHRQMGQHDSSVIVAGGWREVVLLGRGAEPELAPRTVALLRAHAPDAVDLCERGAGEVIVSALAPHTHIRAHCAPSNVRLTAHLALEVPPEGSGRCELRVGAHVLHWAEGRALVFDDSYEHEVVNATDHERVVLLVRFWHPGLASEAARDEALRQAARDARAGENIRHVPPLGVDCERLWRRVCGLEPCAACGLAEGGVSLAFGDEAREAAARRDVHVVGVCACGALCLPGD